MMLSAIANAAPPAPVVAHQVKTQRRDLSRVLALPTMIEPWLWADVPSPAAGLVATVTADVGLVVKHGQVLAAVTVLDANGRAHGEAKVLAPFDGVIAARHAQPGSYAPVGEPLFTLIQEANMRFAVDVPEVELPLLHPGARVRVSIAAYPGRIWDSQVARVSPVVDTSTHTVRAIGELTNPDRTLRSGLSGRVQLELESHERALVVPSAAVVRKDGDYVFRAEGDRARRSPVRVGLEQDGLIEIVSGVADGDVLLVGEAPLADGGAIRVVY
jgi:RND family efflux transporter MFP subunit